MLFSFSTHSNLLADTSAEPASANASSASCYGRAEDVFIEPMVVPELKFRHVEGQILLADLMKRPDHPTFEDRPEAFDGVGMHGPHNILPIAVFDDLMRVLRAQLLITGPLVGDQQAHMIGHRFVHELIQRLGLDVGNDAGDHVALPLDGSHDDRFAGAARASEVSASPFALMFVLGFAADEGFIDFDDPAQLGHVTRRHGYPNPVAHIPGRLVGAKAHVPANLQGTHALLAGQHQMRDLEPILERFVRVLKDRSCDMRKAIGRHRGALVALPMPGITRQGFRAVRATTRTLHALWPTLADQVCAAGLLIRKRLLELWNGQLVQKFFSGHGCVSSSMTGVSHG